MSDITATPYAPAAIAADRYPFWRRIFAFLIDLMVLGSTARAIGSVLGPWLGDLGGWGNLAGGGMAVAYFGIGHSRLFGGTTLGKRLLGIEVRRLDGGYLSLPAAMARALVFVLPMVLNGLPVGGAGAIAFVVMIGLFGGIAFFFFFNAGSHRSLHDLVTRSIVVDRGEAHRPPPVETSPAPRLVVVFAVLLTIVGALVAGFSAVRGRRVDVTPVHRKIIAATGARDVAISHERTDGRRADKWVEVTVTTHRRPANAEQLADRVAGIVLSDVPDAGTGSRIDVTVAHGYDILFDSSLTSRKFSHTPAEWRQRLERSTR